jgi:hypothetical protein
MQLGSIISDRLYNAAHSVSYYSELCIAYTDLAIFSAEYRSGRRCCAVVDFIRPQHSSRCTRSYRESPVKMLIKQAAFALLVIAFSGLIIL